MRSRVSPSRSRSRASSCAACVATAAIIAAAIVAATPGSAFGQQPPARPAPGALDSRPQPKPKNGQITLRNATSDSVRVELRIGDAGDCDKTPVAAEKLVPPGRSWLIAAIHPICWRRATEASARASRPEWMPWHRHVLAVGERRESTL